MAGTSKKSLRLTFATSGGETFSLTLPYPRHDLAPAEIEEVMDLVIEKNVFTTSSGDLTKKMEYKLIDKTP